MSAVPVALLTYSVKPRGGVVHTLALAEALHSDGYPVRVFALGDPGAGFYRTVHAPVTIVPAPPAMPTLEERVFASVDALTGALAGQAAAYPVMHAQDCISARAACAVRDAGPASGPAGIRPAVIRNASTGGGPVVIGNANRAGGPVVIGNANRAGGPIVIGNANRAGGPVVIRTVHHVDDFTSPSLIECQERAIVEPDRVLVVSEHWRRLLEEQYGVKPDVIHNGVDAGRFRTPDSSLVGQLRARAGAADRPLILSVGGIEPRKGSDTLVRALAALRESGRDPVLAVVGGHSFQDYRAYADRVLAMIPELGLCPGRDVVRLGTVPDAELPAWYAAADVLAFPSTKEGWGLAVLEAMSAGLPVVTSDLPVFLEYLRPGRDALVVPVGDAAALARALAAVLDDPALAARLRAAGLAVSRRFTWARSAREHRAIYATVVSPGDVQRPEERGGLDIGKPP